MATVTLSNTTAQLSGKEVLIKDGTHTVTGTITFDKDPSAPFVVTAGSAVVANLDADKVDGYEASALAVLAEAETVSGRWIFSTIPSDVVNGVCEGRLTLTTALPVTTADVTGATTMYFTPYKGNRIALYDGTNWKVYAFTELSLALGTLTSDLPYDVFCYDSSGTPTLEFLAWTNATTRATALTMQNGVLSKTGVLTRRYLGTFYTTSTTATEDSFAKRFVWNYYNRVHRPMRVLEATDTWAYSTATIRQARATTTNQLDVVIGVAEGAIQIDVHAIGQNDTAGQNLMVGIGEDSTTATATGALTPFVAVPVANYYINMRASLRTIPAVGRHYYAWLERGSGTGTTTWSGDAGSPTVAQSGIFGTVFG